MGVFSLFKKRYPEKRKKKTIFGYPGVRYADKKLKFACNFFLENACFTFYCRHFCCRQKTFLLSSSEKMLVIQFSYLEIV